MSTFFDKTDDFLWLQTLHAFTRPIKHKVSCNNRIDPSGHYRKFILWILITICACFHCASSVAQTVILQFNADHPFQFAGYYAAKWQGFYKQVDINVEIIPGVQPDSDLLSVAEALKNGDAQFGIGSIDMLFAIKQGVPIKLLASFFQQSAAAIYLGYVNVDRWQKMFKLLVQDNSTSIHNDFIFNSNNKMVAGNLQTAKQTLFFYAGFIFFVLLVLITYRFILRLSRSTIVKQYGEHRFRKIFEETQIGVAIADSYFAFTEVNPSFSRMLGYSEQELLKMTFADITHPDDKKNSIKITKKLFSGEMSSFQIEKRYLQKNGNILWANLIVSIFKEGNEQFAFAMVENITERKITEQQLKESLSEKESLLMEIHHRVKNNLAMVATLLQLQMPNIKHKDDLILYQSAQNRIHTMALIHKLLYETENFSNLDFTIFIEELTTYLSEVYSITPNSVDINIRQQHLSLNMKNAVPCGLIVNELISNTFKHVFSRNKGTKLTVSFDLADNGNYILKIADDGPGIPDAIDVQNPKSTGLQLVKILTDQLKGQLFLIRDKGNLIRIEFPNIS